MACYELRLGSDIKQRGIQSKKPHLGVGNGGAYGAYSHWHRKNGYIGYIAVSGRAFWTLVEDLSETDLTLSCNVLDITEMYLKRFTKIVELRNIHAFFHSEADMFIFKSMVFELPRELITDDHPNLRDPVVKLYR